MSVVSKKLMGRHAARFCLSFFVGGGRVNQGFILAMVANEIASRPACDKLTYGPVRAEVLSALFSTVTILVLSMLLVYSAIVRIIGKLNIVLQSS